jgi:hypothetical protein
MNVINIIKTALTDCLHYYAGAITDKRKTEYLTFLILVMGNRFKIIIERLDNRFVIGSREPIDV